MSWEHSTHGWEEYDGFIRGLKASGVDFQEVESSEVLSRGSDLYGDPQCLRTARFKAVNGKEMVAEEYLAVDNGDCDGTSLVKLAIYEEGQRPLLYRIIHDGGHRKYPDMPSEMQQSLGSVRLCLNDGTYEVISEEPVLS